MKFHTILILSYFITHSCLAQTNNITVTCPDNTFLGAFSCLDIDNVPTEVNSIEEAMAAPYNIQIEGGDLPENLRATSEDDGVIFFCKNDLRVVSREIIIYTEGIGFPPPIEIFGRCTFTIETIPDTTPLEFTAPTNYEVNCDISEMYPGEVTFTGDDCFAFDQTQAFFTDQTRVEGDNTFIIRTWRTADACGNLSEPQEQIITYNCEERPSINVTVTCPDDTFLGVFDCLNIFNVPDQPGNIEEAMTPPYNIQIEGNTPSDNVRVDTNDSGILFYCPSDSRSVIRNIIIYQDLNINFIYDIGEEIGGCSYTIETTPDLTAPEITIPPDIELTCGVEPDIRNAGDVINYGDDCSGFSSAPTFYSDEIIVDGNITTILRSWSASDPCGNITEPQIQTITINCEPTNNITITCPDDTFLGVFDCLNIADVPELPGNIEEAMAAPYNIQIEGDISPYLRVGSYDDATIFFCPSDSRSVIRTIIFYEDINVNFVYDVGEEIGECSYTIETIPDLTPPEMTIPPDIELACGVEPNTGNAGEVIYYEDDCSGFSSDPTSYSDEITVEDNITTILRSWSISDPCGNISEPQIQTITIDCEQTSSDIIVICPDDTFLGAFDCSNIFNVPDLPGNIEEAMSPPYNIQIEGEITSDIRVDRDDSATIFYCPSDSRTVIRNVIIYKDLNVNFVYDSGEEIGECSYTIETIPDLTPIELVIPPDIELACGVEPDPGNTGIAQYDSSDCAFSVIGDPTFFTDEIIVEGNITTILKSWSASDPCGNITEPQIQTITINCETTPTCMPPNVGTFNCDN